MTYQPPTGQGPIDPRGVFSGPPQPPGMIPPPPPGWFPPPPPPPSGGGRSFSKAILVTLATTIFGFSLMLNIYLLLLSGLTSGGENSRVKVVSGGDPTQKIAVVPVEGMIMSKEAEQFDRLMQRVENDPGVQAVVLQVDTPGGGVTASDEMYHRILKYKAARPGIPVVVSMGSMATSGGYYLACAADYIVAQPTTITVNIGVLMPRYNLAELADKWGVKDSTVKSSGSPYKDAGSMLRAETPEERAYFQTLIDQTYTQFKSVVKSGRGKQIAAAKSTVDEVADGRALIAADAMAKGLVDQIGYLDDATSYAASLKGLTKPTVVKFEERPTLMDMFSSSKFDAGNAKVVNGVNVNVDGNLVKELLTPRMMYLWTGQ